MAAWTVTTPVPGWTGDVGGVHFSDGVAVLDDEANGPALAYCMAAGYGVELAGEEATEDETQKPARRTRSSKETNA
jgi:hypothetical protein